MRAFLLVLAAVAAFLAVERLVVTDGEAIEALLDDAAEAARRGDAAALRATLSDDLEGMDPDEFVAKARALAQRGAPGWGLVFDDVSVSGDEAAVRATVRTSAFGGYSASGRVGLAREAQGWRIRSVKPDDPRWLR